MEHVVRDRFAGVVSYITSDSRVHALSLQFIQGSAGGTNYLSWKDRAGERRYASAHEGAWKILQDALAEVQEYFDRNRNAICSDDAARKAYSKFLLEVCAPLGVCWPGADWLDPWGDEFQRDNLAKQKMVDELLGALLAANDVAAHRSVQ